ncbi:cornifelin homolog [Amia ocellicauda]|uniref:cornifelin homolog n=1 Tax=Amia ocellicauda TaxID=2972642 RepID=UPI0034646FAC|nr:PL8L1 protein [Amia calva]
MTTTVVIQQPQPTMYVNNSNQWSTGICDCCQDLKICCCSFWCFPCFACQTTREYGECLCLPLLDMSGCIPPIGLTLRAGTRERYGIKDTVCNDCLYTVFCYTCSWCQIAREIKLRNTPVVLTQALPRATARVHQA